MRTSLLFLIVILIITACQPGATPITQSDQTPASDPGSAQAVTTEASVEAAGQAATAETAPESNEPTAAPTETPPPTPSAPAPPLVVSTSPERGADVPLDAPLAVTFDQPMAQDTVEAAFSLEPSVEGSLEWVDERTLRFTPETPLERGQQYTLQIAETAESAEGLALNRPFEQRFNTAGFLEVANVQPTDSTTDVAADATITVFFNRPVVPLTPVGQTAALPDPLELDPPVDGQGEWLNTATYQFTPEGSLPAATEFTARIPAGLTDLSGQAELADDFEWTFTTVKPAVIASLPGPGDLYVSPSPVISVAFNQMMDRQAVEQNLTLVNAASGEPVPGEFSWAETGLTPPAPDPAGLPPWEVQDQPAPEPVGVQTVAFTPAESLDLGADYEILLPAGVESEAGVSTEQAYSASFTVTPEPDVVSTTPAAGEQFADPWQGLQITFNAPISPSSVTLGESLILEPDIAATDVYTYWDANATVLNLNFPARENRAYTATLTTDVTGRYGQPLADPVTINWQTLRRSPYVNLVSPAIGLYNGYQNETYIYMTVRNLNRVRFELYTLPVDDFLVLSRDSFRGWSGDDGQSWQDYQPEAANRLGEWQQTTDPETFVNYVYKVDVSQAAFNGEPLPPGLYYLQASAEPEDYYDEAQAEGEVIDRQILVVSRRNLTVKYGQGDGLAWLTDLQDGQPVGGVPLEIRVDAGEAQTTETNNDGVAQFDFELAPDGPSPVLFVLAGDPDQPGEEFAVGSSEWSAGINTFEFGNLWDGSNFHYSSPYAGYVYTARPLYRPGQTVNFKGIIRADDDADYSIPTAAESALVRIYDARYSIIFEDEFSLNGFGTFNGDFVLDEEASLGSYQIEVSYDSPADSTRTVAYRSFNVAEYRKPEFLVEAATDKLAYVEGETIELTVDSAFFFGGPVANAEVRWTLLSDPYYFEYEGEGFYDFTNEPDSRATTFVPERGFGQEIASGTGTTDANGRFSLEVPVDLTGFQTSQSYTFDVAVTGLNNQEVATQARTTVHQGEIYVGLRPTEYLGQVNEANEIEVLTVDWDSQPVADQAVELVVAEENWYSVQTLDPEGSRTNPEAQFTWQNLAENVAVFTTTVTTGPDGLATATFTPAQAGNYKVYARTVDQAGNEVFSSAFLWVTGAEFVNWGQEDNDRIELVADRDQYNTGETASILIPHPYSDTVTALITLERGHIYDYFVTELESNSSQIEIPITAEMHPNIYVSATLMDGSSGASEVPSFKLGYTRLNVDPAEKALQIDLTPSDPELDLGYYVPGDDVQFNVEVTDFEGNPVEAEVSLALIDKAVLTLFPDPPGQLLDAFWLRRPLQVNTGVSLTLALERINRALDERKGGGGGDGGIGPDSVRQEFADTALWLPELVTDESGQATAEVELPDNLTTWVLIARAVTGEDTLVGEARTEIVASKPLLVRPVTPRFLTTGDQVEMSMIVQSNFDEALTVQPSFEAEGLTIESWRPGAEAGAEWQALAELDEVTVEPGEELELEFQTTVEEAPLAQLTMGARGETYGDGTAFELPIFYPAMPETVATVGVLPEDGQRVEGIALPAEVVANQGALSLQVEPSLAAGLRSGLSYLNGYPYESSEQTASRLLANLYLNQVLPPADSAGGDRLPTLVSQAVQRLISQQNVDGGWGWWQGAPSQPFLTAYVLLALAEARQADFTVEDWIVQSAVDYLNNQFDAPQDIEAGWQANQQAFILYALAQAGDEETSRAVALFENQREQLDTYGKAFLALALHQTDSDAPQIETLLSDITDAAVTSATGAHWEERQVDLQSMNTDVRSTAIVVTALSELEPDHPLLPQAVRWLMTTRSQGGHWSSTQETAWSIIGLSEWLTGSGDLEAEYRWQVALNGQALADGEVDAATLAEATDLRVAVSELLTEAVNRLTIERESVGGDEAGNLYYGAYLTTYRPVEEVEPLDRGIVVSRQYSLQGSDQPLSEAEVGDFITVKLTLVAPNDLHYVVVEDYLPAGAEALDSSLATTSLTADQPQVERTGAEDQWGAWRFTHTDLRDEKAVLFADYLPQGVYEYTYTIRASIPGEYQVVPAQARLMYFPEVFGRSAGETLTISE